MLGLAGAYDKGEMEVPCWVLETVVEWGQEPVLPDSEIAGIGVCRFACLWKYHGATDSGSADKIPDRVLGRTWTSCSWGLVAQASTLMCQGMYLQQQASFSASLLADKMAMVFRPVTYMAQETIWKNGL